MITKAPIAPLEPGAEAEPLAQALEQFAQELLDLRRAAKCLAVDRVARAHIARGLYP